MKAANKYENFIDKYAGWGALFVLMGLFSPLICSLWTTYHQNQIHFLNVQNQTRQYVLEHQLTAYHYKCGSPSDDKGAWCLVLLKDNDKSRLNCQEFSEGFRCLEER